MSWQELPPKKQQRMEKVISRGRNSFIWRRGILGWGLPVFIASSISRYYTMQVHHYQNLQNFLLGEGFMLPVWLIAGYFVGRGFWKQYNDMA